MPSDRFFKIMNAVHRNLLKVSGGKVGWTLGGMPVLKLTTIGRMSGNPQSVLLTVPHEEDNRLIIVASKGGENTHPTWFLNLQKTPQVIVATENEGIRNMIARVAAAQERERLWAMVISKHDNYASYQEKTNRKIPLVILEPTD